MRAADDQDVDLGDEVAQQVDLGRHLGAADDRGTGRSGLPSALGQRLELRLHRPAGEGRQPVREPLGRGVGAVGGREGVVDVDIAELRASASTKRRIVLFLARVEAGVLEEQDVAVLQRRRPLRRPPRRCSRPRRRPAARGRSASAGATGSQRIGFVRACPSGRPKWASRITLPPLSAISRIVGGDALDPGRVGDAAVLHRHVEVDAQKHAACRERRRRRGCGTACS